jgi:hypothetical protein
MLTAVEGVFRDGRVELRETPENIQDTRVIVTFLGTTTDPGSADRAATPEERLRAFRSLVATLPEAPAVPLAALDRENLYP